MACGGRRPAPQAPGAPGTRRPGHPAPQAPAAPGRPPPMAPGAPEREHAGDLVEQLLTGDDDISGAVGRFFQDATSGAATALVAAAFGPAQEAVRELHEISEWAAAIAQKVWRLAADLKSPQASVSAERYLTLLGPAAGICLASEVIKAKAVDFAPRMATIRGLISCFTRPLDKAQLPDLACAALSEWIYEPSVETLPVPGLELVKLQRPEEHHGINLQWALLRDQWGSCFLVFRGSETVLDWTENSYMSLRRVNVPSWQGVLLLHSGFWSTAEAESECLRQAIVEAAAGVPFEELILCGGSKGGANALAAAIQWSLPLTGRAWLDDLPCRELVVVTFGAPNIAGRGSGQPETTRALEELQAALHKRAPRSRAWRFIEDPVPALMSARSQQVLGQYYKGASGLALGAMRRFMPNAYKKGHKYLQEAMRVTATFQAVLPEALLDPPPDVSRGEFDASVHPQRNYTEARQAQRMLAFAGASWGSRAQGAGLASPASAPRRSPSSASQGRSAAALFAALVAADRRLRPRPRVQLRPFRRDLSLEGYPIHCNGYYWTLSKCTEAVLIYIPIADDVKKEDVVFDCRNGVLQAGLVPEKGGLVINDKVLYEVDVIDSYFTLDDGEYGERCLSIWLEKRTKEQLWYAYDRFEPVSERFLLQGEKKKAELKFQITKKCFLDIEIDEKPMGRIVLGLYGDTMPRTVENFKCLCTGEKGTSKHTGEPLHYKGTRIHRVIPGFCIQGGQTFENEEGSGGESIYGPIFEDENLRMKFTDKGLIAMANGGPNTNGSQFFITTAKAEHLNFKSVGFGEVLDGYEVVKAIESIGTIEGEPEETAVIVDCGTLEFEEGEQEKLKNRRRQGGVDLTLRNEMIERVRGATAQGL
ncbi:unnamed protein product [Effrenium voratum]|uniref:peptidylprolyl isomerase n=1 Tax=Effrenium voratum TaxID=2562239 RepID=A0AA36JHH2_9DINO|nr:unnamed protein product [Effrenium voratum]